MSFWWEPCGLCCLEVESVAVVVSVNDEQFALQFHNNFRCMLGEFVVFMPACLQDGQQAFTTMIQARLVSGGLGMCVWGGVRMLTF